MARTAKQVAALKKAQAVSAAKRRIKPKRPTKEMAKTMRETGKASPKAVVQAADTRRYTSDVASLAKLLAGAQKSGDKAKVAKIQKQLKALGGRRIS